MTHWPDLTERNETQAETIRRLWHRVAKQQAIIDGLRDRADAQQAIIDRQEARIAELTDPRAAAEALFTETSE